MLEKKFSASVQTSINADAGVRSVLFAKLSLLRPRTLAHWLLSIPWNWQESELPMPTRRALYGLGLSTLACMLAL